MKHSTYMYLSAFVLSSCLSVVTTTSSTTSSAQTTITASGTSIAPSTSTNATSETSDSTNTSTPIASSTLSTSQTNDGTGTSQTTQRSTMATTQSTVLCKNGSCSGNDSCMNNITETCVLTESESCFQIVHTNETYVSYEVGCKTSCEYLVQDTADETRTTRCCTTDMCNKVLLSDPDPDNDAARSYLSIASLVLAILICCSFT